MIAIWSLYQVCRAPIERSFEMTGLSLDDDQLRAVFATVAAYSARPYGPSTANTLETFLAAGSLDCDNKNILASEFYEQLGGERPWRYVGWYAGRAAVGNHSQGFLEGETPLLLDPTVGLVAVADFDAVASGRPVASDRMVSFFWRDEIDAYWTRVSTSLLEGRLRPSHIMYWFPDTDAYIAAPGSSAWETPGAYALNTRLSNPSHDEIPAASAPSPGAFADWSASGGAEVLASETGPDILMLGEGGMVHKTFGEHSVLSGDVFSASINMRAETETRVAVQLLRYCAATPGEVGSMSVSVGPDPIEYSFETAFEHDHVCLRMQIVGLEDVARVEAWGPSIELNVTEP